MHLLPFIRDIYRALLTILADLRLFLAAWTLHWLFLHRERQLIPPWPCLLYLNSLARTFNAAHWVPLCRRVQCYRSILPQVWIFLCPSLMEFIPFWMCEHQSWLCYNTLNRPRNI